MHAESNVSITSDNKWYGDCKERGHCRLNFLHQITRHVKAYNNICLVYTKLHALSYMVTSYRFFGGPYRFTWFGGFFTTIEPSLTKVVYAYFDRSSYGKHLLQTTDQLLLTIQFQIILKYPILTHTLKQSCFQVKHGACADEVQSVQISPKKHSLKCKV